LSTMSDNVLVVVLPSFEVCGRKKKPFISNTRRKLTTWNVDRRYSSFRNAFTSTWK
jgi:hypothetical protein